MAEKKLTFPRIIISNWWELRYQAQKTPDISFTTENISFLLNISTSTVHVNVLPALRLFELIDKKGNLTERGRRWLIDKEYKEVCTDIIETIYPVDLLTLVDNPAENRQAIKKWFLDKTHSPMNSVLQMTATYILLCDGTPKPFVEKGESKDRKIAGTKEVSGIAEAFIDGQNGSQPHQNVITVPVDGLAKRKYTRRIEQPVLPAQPLQTEILSEKNGIASKDVKVKPSVNINIQLVLTSQTSSEQIEALFAGIGKYLIIK